MHTKIFSAATIGVQTCLIEVEVDLSYGLLQFFIVGLPDTAVKESRQRIATALKNCGVKLPERKITVNLAPADVKKEGTVFDLPIALGIIIAAQLIIPDPGFLEETIFMGELSLDGSVKSVKGVLAIACDAQALGKKRIIVPAANAQEAALINNIEVIAVQHVHELVAFLRKEKQIEPTKRTDLSTRASQPDRQLDFNEVKGHRTAKRVLQIAAAGRHNILFVGSPGSGKTMLAQRLSSIMPPMSFDEIIETTKIYSVSGKLGTNPLIMQRPFRSPHHTISQAGLVGGGTYPQPGEISLAHHGVLFLDELTEFKRSVLEVLRQPLEQKSVSIARANQTITFPASFLFVAALNPCPCGFLADKKRSCICTPFQIAKYHAKLSGPLLDRIDLQIHISSIDYATLSEEEPISSKKLYEGVEKAGKLQQRRFDEATLRTTGAQPANDLWANSPRANALWANAHLTPAMIAKFCTLSSEAHEFTKKAFENLQLTMRSYHKLLKVGRTIADIEGSDIIQVVHMKEALMYRSMDYCKDMQEL